MMFKEQTMEKVEIIIEGLQELHDNGELESYDDLSEAVTEEVDRQCIYTSDNWDMAKEADIDQLDSGLWEGSEHINEMIARIAYASLVQEVWNEIYRQDLFSELL